MEIDSRHVDEALATTRAVRRRLDFARVGAGVLLDIAPLGLELGMGGNVAIATRERVEWILEGTERPRQQMLGKVLPRGAIATVESCAIALAMAGGRPEYLPVLIAAVEAFLDPLSDSEHMQADSAGAFPVVIVNGPIAAQIRLNTTFGCLGPDPQRPAGGSIGRALRLMQQNLGGALPGVGAMAMWGAMRYTNAVFGEHTSKIPVTSNKSAVGHTISAAGAVEAIFSLLTLEHQRIPPTLNYGNPDPAIPFDVVGNKARDARVTAVMSNSFGFGGQNASLILAREPA